MPKPKKAPRIKIGKIRWTDRELQPKALVSTNPNFCTVLEFSPYNPNARRPPTAPHRGALASFSAHTGINNPIRACVSKRPREMLRRPMALRMINKRQLGLLPTDVVKIGIQIGQIDAHVEVNTLLNAATAKFGAQAIRKIADLDWHPLHVIVQATSSIDNVLKPAGLEQSKGLMTIQFVKFPGDPEWENDPAMKEYYAFMKQWAPKEEASDSTATFAYMNTMLTERILRNAGNDLSRENVLKQATYLTDVELPLLLPGIKVNYSPDDYSPIQQARVARFDGTKWIRIGDLISAKDIVP